MFAEIIIYIALFSVFFCGAFTTVFDTLNNINYLQNKKDFIDSKYFLSSKLDAWLLKSANWQVIGTSTLKFIRNDIVNDEYILSVKNNTLYIDCLSCQSASIEKVSGPDLYIENFFPSMVATSTGTGKILYLNLDINKQSYKFSYYAEK